MVSTVRLESEEGGEGERRGRDSVKRRQGEECKACCLSVVCFRPTRTIIVLTGRLYRKGGARTKTKGARRETECGGKWQVCCVLMMRLVCVHVLGRPCNFATHLHSQRNCVYLGQSPTTWTYLQLC